MGGAVKSMKKDLWVMQDSTLKSSPLYWVRSKLGRLQLYRSWTSVTKCHGGRHCCYERGQADSYALAYRSCHQDNCWQRWSIVTVKKRARTYTCHMLSCLIDKTLNTVHLLFIHAPFFSHDSVCNDCSCKDLRSGLAVIHSHSEMVCVNLFHINKLNFWVVVWQNSAS